VQRDRWEFKREGDTRGQHTPFDCVDEGWYVAVTGIESGVGVYYADDEFGEGGVRVACSFDECFAEEEGKVWVAVICEAGSKTSWTRGFMADAVTVTS